MHAATFEALQDFARVARIYRALRRQYPATPARLVHAWVRHDGHESFAEFTCPGHRWHYTGTAYGGDDPSYHGDGRVYCSICGADGDA